MTLQEAYEIRFGFGKHRGETVKEVVNDDPAYIDWATDLEASAHCPESLIEAVRIVAEAHRFQIDRAINLL